VAAALCRPAASALVIFWYERWIPGIAFELRRLRDILGYSVASFGSRVLWATYDQADAFVLGKIAGETSLGFYSMARDLASLPVVKISTAVNQLAVPVMAELQTDRQAMRNALLRGIRLVAGVSFPLCAGLALVAEDAVRLALTEKWLPIVPIVQILCAAALVKSLDVLLPPVLRARFRAGFLARYNLVLLLVMPLLFLWGALRAGGVGVAVAWVTGYPLVMAWMAREALREIDLGWRTLLAQLKMPVLAVLAMSAVVLVLQHVLAGAGEARVWVRLAAAIAGGAATYCAILWIRGGQLTEELRELARWILRPRSGSR
jgi:O-antigen/teichoic acid export membrane protein